MFYKIYSWNEFGQQVEWAGTYTPIEIARELGISVDDLITKGNRFYGTINGEAVMVVRKEYDPK